MSDLIRRVSARRKLLARGWRDRADLYVATSSKDDKGATTQLWPATPTISQIKGACQGSWGYERKNVDRVTAIQTLIFLCEWTEIRISEKDRLKINNRWYEVEVVDDVSFSQVYQELQLLELT